VKKCIELIIGRLIFRSIGYYGVPVEEGIPYDHQKGIVPNIDGFVEPGLYCAGWLATGPRGVIVDTMTEAFKVGYNELYILFVFVCFSLKFSYNFF
jgi:adrenodoxin-NADP+ reductase